MVLLRHLLGDALRRLRLRQGRTLREVSATARVSLGYLSEVERGQKEASSELLASICDALGAPLSQVLREVSDNFALAELQSEPVFGVPLEPALAGAGGSASADRVERVAVGQPQRVRLPVRPGTARPGSARQPVVVPGRAARAPQHLVPPAEPLLEPVSLPDGDSLARDITNMVPV
jgi:transcriptional regulator with XRE-family HTH domain